MSETYTELIAALRANTEALNRFAAIFVGEMNRHELLHEQRRENTDTRRQAQELLKTLRS